MPHRIYRTLVALSFVILSGCATSGLSNKSTYSIYLSGPEMFLADPAAAIAKKKALLEKLNVENNWRFHLVGLSQLDNQIEDYKPDAATGIKIFKANIELMNQADFILANTVRFRGPGMAVGTAFEMGYMRGLGKPIFAYYDAKPFYDEAEPVDTYETRVKTHYPVATNGKQDIHGLTIENFGMADSLMTVGSLQNGNGEIAASFEEAVLAIAAFIESQRNR